VANNRQTSLLELIATLNDILEMDVQPDHQPERVGDVRHSLADIQRAQTLLGYQSRVSLREGLEQSIDYYRTLVDR